MGKEVGKCLSTRIVIENLLAIGLNSGETVVEYLLADEIVYLVGEIVLGGAEKIANQLHQVELIAPGAAQRYAIEFRNRFHGREFRH